MAKGDILQVVLETFVDDEGADVVRVLGVWPGWDPVPPPRDGRVRNTVRVFEGFEMDARGFRIWPRIPETEE